MEKQKNINMFVSQAKLIVKQGRVKEMEGYLQHGNLSTLDHVLLVAYYSWRINRLFHLHSNEKALIRGALLHDYYLYDWHDGDKTHRLHGFRHPAYALQNAKEDYTLSAIEEEIIRKHMWPLTMNPPMCREAWIVNLIDDVSTVIEVMMEFRILACLKRVWYLRLKDSIFYEIKTYEEKDEKDDIYNQ